MFIFEQMKLLNANGLHSNLVMLGSLLLTSVQNQLESPPLSVTARYQTMVYIGKALQSQGEYKRAVAMYKNALQLAKTVTKTKSVKTSELYKEGASEIDVKYALSECYCATREFGDALAILDPIPKKHRTPKVNMTLGKLYLQTGKRELAVNAYKDVLKECPLALEAMQELLSLDVSGAEVASLLIDIPGLSPMTEWLCLWVKGHAQLYTRDYINAISSFKQLEDNSVLHHSPLILTILGETYFLAGDNRNALATLQRAHSLDPLNLKGIDLLACLLAGEKRTRELETLASAATSINDAAPQPWITMGYYCQLTKRTTKAIYFAHKACSINPRSVEGLLLKGTLLLELKKLEEAVMHFREVMKIASNRFEAHKGLVDCYLAMNKLREASTIASSSYKELGQTPQCLTLHASVLSKNASSVSKAKLLLEKALKQDPYFLPAVYLLNEIHEQDKKYSLSVELLRKQVAVQPTSQLHQMLADSYSHLQDEENAAYHYNVAINLSHSSRSIEASSKTEPNADDVEPSTYQSNMEVEDIVDSEGEVEESDLEAVWSDVDYSINER